MNVFKKIVMAIAVFAFATTAFAASLNTDSRDYYVFRTTNMSGTNGSANNWSRSTTIGEGQLLSFAMYYHAVGGTLNDVRFRMDNLHQQEYSDGQSINVRGTVSAANASNSSGTSNVTFTDDVELRIYNVSWQPNQCTSVTCERSLPGGQNSSNVLTSGITIGDVAPGWPTQGSVVVTFKAYPAEVTPTYDDCTVNGVTVAHGVSRTFYSRTSVDYGQSCGSYDQIRSCNDGTLSGSNSYQYTSCSVEGEPADDEARVTTNGASNIDEDSATLNGSFDKNDWGTSEVYFQWGTSSSNLNNTTSKSTKSSDGSFSKSISGLDDDRTYYYRAVAEENASGDKVYGSVKSFRTDDEGGSSDDQDVTTRPASNIDDDSARLNGEWEGDDNTRVWFAFDENDDTPSCNDSSQREGLQIVDDGEDFSDVITGLDENEKYYFRACAEDSDGDTISGSIRNFTTDEEDDDDDDDDNVDVTTKSATNVDEDSARLNGEVEGDDNVEVWFALSRTDTTPSCNVSSQRVSVSGSYDDGEDFSRVASGLQENEKYYFRACAEDSDGSIESGSIRSFVTDEDDDNDNGGSSDPRAVTNVASGITTNSARLNAIVLGDGNATCYFQYGRTTSFGLTSPRTAVDLDRTSNCSSFRAGLASNSTYYYRAVIEQDGERYFGSTRTFRTNRTTTVVSPRPQTPTNNGGGNTTITIVNQNENTVSVDEVEVTKWVSAENDPRFDTATEAAPGETVYYKVRVTNDTDEDLEDVVVIDRIPFFLELDESASIDDDDDKQIRWVIDLDEGESRTFITEMRVREDARDGDIIESYATAQTEDYSVNSNDVIIEVEDRSFSDNNDEEEPNQTANIFGSGFFPTTLVGWGLLLLVVLAIAYFVSRILIARNENQKVLAELHAARAARNTA